MAIANKPLKVSCEWTGLSLTKYKEITKLFFFKLQVYEISLTFCTNLYKVTLLISGHYGKSTFLVKFQKSNETK